MDSLEIKMIHWRKTWKIPGTPWTIKGYSRSAYRTGFYIPSLKMMLDAGPQNFNKPDHILITHSHIDHVASLPLTMIGDELGFHIFNIYGPLEAEEYFKNYIQSMFRLNAVNQDVPVEDWYRYIPLKHGDIFPIKSDNSQLEIKVFKCDHSIPTISYGISIIKDKLREEYKGIPSREIGKLKHQGVSITHKVKESKLAYVCDTSINFFQVNPEIFNYPVIFTECTFFLPEELVQSINTKHIHWKQLKEYVVKYPEITFVLFHFSQRYKDAEIKDFFSKVTTEEGINNIYCWTSQ